MKRHLLALALLSSIPLVMTATAAMAQDQDHGWQQDDHGYDHDHGHDHDHDRDRHDDHGWRDDDHHDHGRHVGWDRHYRRGEYLPERYRGPDYYVVDYPRYRLYAPPQGYRWVRSDDGGFVLVAVATGLIINEILNP
ncbi:RcnB family protein [Dyella sp. 2HG41-7]|uniref:RcnB family protein n=1 Tax=Dyella sp. 2HG41-7 TaxID=2883239 RepID=UPI001F22EC23|nr:RcnB family protein [Dyella sp. 2HG41-7]